MNENKAALIRSLKENSIEFLENEPLRSYSSIKAGGIADLIIFPRNEKELAVVASLFNSRSIKFFVTGKGTNTLFKGERTRTPIVSFRKGFKELKELGGRPITGGDSAVELKVGSGVLLSQVLNYAIKNTLGGCEFFYGIPGSFGGAISMNAGSKESTIGSIIKGIRILTQNGEELDIDRKDIEFSYRKLRIKNMKLKFFITSSTIRLYRTQRKEIFDKIKIFKERKSSQPLGEYSLGCIFRNPPGIPAGKIIDEIGLKGLFRGGARISNKHANFIVNPGMASSSDIMELIRIIQERSMLEKGIRLRTEIKIV